MREARCQVCNTPYHKQRMGQKVCGIRCANSFQFKQQEKAQRKQNRERRKSLMTRADHAKKAQTAFNAYIRERDKDQPCISCGRYHQGQYHASHYRSVKAQPALRFNELNCHKACMPCNTHLSGNIVEYRLRLIDKIGTSLVEWLDVDHKQPSKWTIPELIAVTDYYRRALREMRQ